MQPPPARPEEELQAALAAAPDRALGRVVCLLDSLEARGAADAVLDAVRPRLRDLRPTRPLRFTRLLALPLEPALVATEAWTRAPGEIPRAALTPLSDAVRAAIGEAAEAIDVAALGHGMADAAVVARLGARLWPLAAEAPLPRLPALWRAADLPVEAAAPILETCRAMWAARRG
jgi:hypothetical protein